MRKQPHRPTNSQISLKPEGDVFVAGSDSTQQLLARCHAAVSDPWYLEGRFRELIACATRHPEKPPACAGGSCSCSRVAAYRLAWRLAPPPGPLAGPLPRMSPVETSLTQSEPLPLKYEVAVALRSASRLSCAVPVDAVVNPGSSNITHEPAFSSDTLRDRAVLSVLTLNSEPARTLVAPLTGKSLPLRLRTATGGPGSPMRPVLAPTPPPRPPAAPGAGAAPL